MNSLECEFAEEILLDIRYSLISVSFLEGRERVKLTPLYQDRIRYDLDLLRNYKDMHHETGAHIKTQLGYLATFGRQLGVLKKSKK